MPAIRNQPGRHTPTAAKTPVSKIMTRDVISVRAGTSIESVIELMLGRGLSRVPVVDDAWRPLGIISKTDLVQESHDRGEDGEQAPPLRRFDKYVEQRGFHEQAAGATAGEVMTRTLVTVSERDSIASVAELMVSRHLHGVPVVSPDGELTGFVSSSDVLGWLAGLQ